MGIESQVAEGEEILHKEECPFVKSCSSAGKKDFDERIYVCVKNYENCPTYLSRMDQMPVYD